MQSLNYVSILYLNMDSATVIIYSKAARSMAPSTTLQITMRSKNNHIRGNISYINTCKMTQSHSGLY